MKSLKYTLGVILIAPFGVMLLCISLISTILNFIVKTMGKLLDYLLA